MVSSSTYVIQRSEREHLKTRLETILESAAGGPVIMAAAQQDGALSFQTLSTSGDEHKHFR